VDWPKKKNPSGRDAINLLGLAFVGQIFHLKLLDDLSASHTNATSTRRYTDIFMAFYLPDASVRIIGTQGSSTSGKNRSVTPKIKT